MKKLIIGCAALASALALNAAVESGNTFGILKVVSNQEQVIISVPWVTVGSSSSGTTISPTDLVCTTGLRKDDYMLYYDSSSGNYSSWVINSSYAWEADNVLEGTKLIGSKADSDLTVARGKAIILVRSATTISNTGGAIYLNGQYKTGPASVPMTAGTVGSPAMTFFAPTTAAPVNLNDDFTYTAENHPVAGDKIRYGVGMAGGDETGAGRVSREFFYKGEWGSGGSWFCYKTFTWKVNGNTKIVTEESSDCELPAGVAAIYISVGGHPTFSL